MDTPTTFAGRIQLLVDAAPSQKAFAGYAHISADTLLNWLRGHPPHAGAVRRVADFLGVALEWLRDGKGDAYQQIAAFREGHDFPPAVPGELIRQARLNEGISQKTLAYRLGSGVKYVDFLERGMLPQPSKDVVTSLCHALPTLKRNELLTAWGYPPMDDEGNEFTWGRFPGGTKGNFVPLIAPSELEMRVDHGCQFFQRHVLIFLFDQKDWRGFGIRVPGSSMEPVLSHDDVVVCSPGLKLKDGDAALVRTRSGQLFVKYWHQRGGLVTLESANPRYRPLEFPLEEITGAAPVVQAIRIGKMRQPQTVQPPPESPRKTRKSRKASA